MFHHGNVTFGAAVKGSIPKLRIHLARVVEGAVLHHHAMVLIAFRSLVGSPGIRKKSASLPFSIEPKRWSWPT